MSNQNDTDEYFKFFPRPEAHTARWSDLLSPVQAALRNLLVRISGTLDTVARVHDHDDGSEDDITNCFLVYGDRGTGKTTVLLNAAQAVHDEESFFQNYGLNKDGKHENDEDENSKGNSAKKESAKEENDEEEEERLLAEFQQKLGKVAYDARQYASRLQPMVWLAPLDLEPLPAKSNLLTIVLTRVRDALELSDLKGLDLAPTSLFEEREGGARQQLAQLINDATLMWEDITEADTRSRANRQVAAADIYAGFRKRFLDAMKALSQEINVIRYGRRVGCCPIVLPIDNIDRSTDHLYNIIKLAQMVSCRQLFLVMAGDRVDVETFLERAYWKELIRTGDGSNASGKAGLEGEDEAFVMARRQSAASSQKLLPPSHRIEVQRVSAEETLAFCPHADTGKKDKPGHYSTICQLLENVPIPVWAGGPFLDSESRSKMGPEGNSCLRLVDLFNAAPLLEPVYGPGRVEKGCAKWREEDTGLRLTLAGKHALQLSARGVIDLWQLAYWVVNDNDGFPAKDSFKAEKIARTMLRNITAESKMSSYSGHLLQDRIIRRNAEHGTVLDLSDTQLDVRRLVIPKHRYRVTPVSIKIAEDKQWTVRPVLTLYDIEAVLLGIKTSAEASATKPELPPTVAAWLVILHDLVFWSEKSVVINRNVPNARMVKVVYRRAYRNHGECNPVELAWPAPQWQTFLAHRVFNTRWKKFLEKLEESLAEHERLRQPKYRFRLLVCGWIACSLDTFCAFWKGCVPAKETVDMPGLAAHILPSEAEGIANNKGADAKDPIEASERKVVTAAAKLYASLYKGSSVYKGARVGLPRRWTSFMLEWLEQDLPRLFDPLYVPMDLTEPTDTARGYCQRMLRYLEQGTYDRAETHLHVPMKSLSTTPDYCDLKPASPEDKTYNHAEKDLLSAWKENAPFIQARIDEDLAKLFTDPILPKTDKERIDAVSTLCKDRKKLEGFGCMPSLLLDLADDKGTD